METPRARKIETEKYWKKPRLKEGSFINYAFPGDETRKEAKEKFAKIFTEQERQNVEERLGLKIEETEKTPKQIETINFINRPVA
ncbi:hypothetical protein KJ636_04935 [Patescibacteria group bacterium]|nr:hypothetical protein [Patescibacteria group bacterium]